MAPIYQIETSVEKAKALRELGFNLTNLDKESNNTFIYVPSINLYVAKERALQGANWFEAHKQLQGNGERMLTVPEFVEFLKYVRENNLDIYQDITEVRRPWRAEWLDADFKAKKNLHINYNHVLDSNGNPIPQSSEPLDRNTLMEDRKISLESWLSNPTEQGFPTKKVASGNFYYLYPRCDNISVAVFGAFVGGSILDCGRNPSGRFASLGVRACKVGR